MFAVVRTGGKQYRVAAGDKIVVDRMDGDAGARVSLGDVLFASEGSVATVAAEIVAQAKADKIVVFKKKRRHNYRRKNGHRQQHTILRILSIGEEKKAAKAKPAPAPVEAAPAPVEAAPTPAPVIADAVAAEPVKKAAVKKAPAADATETKPVKKPAAKKPAAPKE